MQERRDIYTHGWQDVTMPGLLHAWMLDAGIHAAWTIDVRIRECGKLGLCVCRNGHTPDPWLPDAWIPECPGPGIPADGPMDPWHA